MRCEDISSPNKRDTHTERGSGRKEESGWKDPHTPTRRIQPPNKPRTYAGPPRARIFSPSSLVREVLRESPHVTVESSESSASIRGFRARGKHMLPLSQCSSSQRDRRAHVCLQAFTCLLFGCPSTCHRLYLLRQPYRFGRAPSVVHF
jgi:hypothetical protein